MVHFVHISDMVDEAKDNYGKRPLDLDEVNENKPIPNPTATAADDVEANGGGELSPSAPEDNNSSGGGGGQQNDHGDDPLQQV